MTPELDMGFDTIGGKPTVDLTRMETTMIDGTFDAVNYTYQFEAMDATGQEIKDTIQALNEPAAMEAIRKMGYFVTKIHRVKNGVPTKPKTDSKKFWYRILGIVLFPIWFPFAIALAIILNIMDGVELFCSMVLDSIDDVRDYFHKD
jgi:hypothetical protein